MKIEARRLICVDRDVPTGTLYLVFVALVMTNCGTESSINTSLDFWATSRCILNFHQLKLNPFSTYSCHLVHTLSSLAGFTNAYKWGLILKCSSCVNKPVQLQLILISTVLIANRRTTVFSCVSLITCNMDDPYCMPSVHLSSWPCTQGFCFKKLRWKVYFLPAYM